MSEVAHTTRTANTTTTTSTTPRPRDPPPAPASPVALAICGRYRQANGHVPIWTVVESPMFRREYGPLRDRLPAAGLPVGGDERLGALVADALAGSVDPPSGEVVVSILRGDRRPFVAEAFYNQHCLFVMLAPKARIKTGRRVAVAAR